MSVLALTHLACALAYASLAGLIAAGKPANRAAWQALAAAVLTAIWATMVGFSGFGLSEAVPLVETLRTLSWLVFAGSLLLSAPGAYRAFGKAWLAVIPIVAVLVLALDFGHFAALPPRPELSPEEVLGRIGLAVIGIVAIENLFRNTAAESRWAITPLCIGLAGIFGFELIVYSDTFLLHRADPALLAARAVANIIAVPLIVLSMARHRNWRINIHVSRAVVFHTATFIASGAFLLSIALLSTVFRAYGGEWGPVAQLSLIFAGVLALALALSTGGLRSRLRRIIAENFYSHRYDYRAEWVKFIDVLSSAGVADLQERVIKAVADIVDSPAGALWLLRDGAFRPATLWNMRLPDGVREPADGPFVASFGDGTAVRCMDAVAADALPSWMSGSASFWLAVPLPHQGEIIGFLVLAKSRAPFRLDWEVFQLLGTVARQAASYLSEERTARALADAELLGDYSKRFAFVVHDIKNLVSQLNLVLANAEKFGSDPAFQQDALHTIRSSVERMTKLLQQLKSAEVSRKPAMRADVEQVVHDVLGSARSGARVLTALSGCAPRATIDPAALHSALTHLVNNAIEASGDDGSVTVRVDAGAEQVTVDICDQGPGMEPAFVRNELFRPFRSTKSSGYGIGAYQARELVRAAGGDLEVISRPGAGTTMRLIVPAVKQPETHVVSAA